MIERVKTEGVVDVFQTVRKLRTKRPAMVQTKVWWCYFILIIFIPVDIHEMIWRGRASFCPQNLKVLLIRLVRFVVLFMLRYISQRSTVNLKKCTRTFCKRISILFYTLIELPDVSRQWVQFYWKWWLWLDLVIVCQFYKNWLNVHW